MAYWMGKLDDRRPLTRFGALLLLVGLARLVEETPVPRLAKRLIVLLFRQDRIKIKAGKAAGEAEGRKEKMMNRIELEGKRV